MRIPGYFRISSDNISEALFILYFTLTAFAALFSKLFSPFGISGNGIAIVTLIILMLAAVPNGVKYGLKDCFFLYAGIVLLFVVSLLINPEVISWYKNPNWGLANRVFRPDRGIYAYLIVRLVTKKRLLVRDIKIVGYINFLYTLYLGIKRILMGYWEILANDGVTRTQTPYNMAYGYSAAFVALIMFLFMDKKNRLYHLFFGIISALFAIVFGSRGALLVFAVYAGIVIVLKLKENLSPRKIIICTVCLLILILVALNYSSVIRGLLSLAGKLGLESRNLQRLISADELTRDVGRYNIAALSMEGIREIFPFGFGAYGDRLYVGRMYAWGYSHNIGLEMTASFGILGIAFLLVLTVVSFRFIFMNRDAVWRNIYILFFCSSMKLLVSDSFWFWPFFWALFAVIKCRNREKASNRQ